MQQFFSNRERYVMTGTTYAYTLDCLKMINSLMTTTSQGSVIGIRIVLMGLYGGFP
jgi:hypothetical protein